MQSCSMSHHNEMLYMSIAPKCTFAYKYWQLNQLAFPFLSSNLGYPVTYF